MKESEVRADLDRLYSLVEELKVKYGKDIAVYTIAAIKLEENEYFTRSTVLGDEELVYSCIEEIMNTPNFIKYFIPVLERRMLEKAVMNNIVYLATKKIAEVL